MLQRDWPNLACLKRLVKENRILYGSDPGDWILIAPHLANGAIADLINRYAVNLLVLCCRNITKK